MKPTEKYQIELDDRLVDYAVVRSRAAKRLRVRVGPAGVEVLQPAKRNDADVPAFLGKNGEWILNQLRRVERLRSVRRSAPRGHGEILFRGQPTRVRAAFTKTRSRGNLVDFVGGEIVVCSGTSSQTTPARSLENWLRRQARSQIEHYVQEVTKRLRQRARKVYVMGQRTKWGNCSSQRNLSFNWRLILAPDFVLRYIVTHETVHLAIPDHSAKFWLTVQSLCDDTQRAKRWLAIHQAKLMIDLSTIDPTGLKPRGVRNGTTDG